MTNVPSPLVGAQENHVTRFLSASAGLRVSILMRPLRTGRGTFSLKVPSMRQAGAQFNLQFVICTRLEIDVSDLAEISWPVAIELDQQNAVLAGRHDRQAKRAVGGFLGIEALVP